MKKNINDSQIEATMHNSTKDNKVGEVFKYLSTVRTYKSFVEEAEKTTDLAKIDEIKKQAFDAFDEERLSDIIFFDNKQVEELNIFCKELDNVSVKVFLKDSIMSNDRLRYIIKTTSTVKDFVNFYNSRTKYGFKAKDLNCTIMRFVHLNVLEDKYYIEVLPVNFLEALILSYVKHHQFEDDSDKELKKSILKIIKSGKLRFDKKLFTFYDKVIDLLEK